MTKHYRAKFKKNADKTQRDVDPWAGCWFPGVESDKPLIFVPPDKAKKVFKHLDLFGLLMKGAILLNWFSGGDPFHTHQEFLELIEKFIQYLDANKNSLLLTGYPGERFGSSSWFYRTLARLYPVKVPASIRERDLACQKAPKTDSVAKGNPTLLYIWCRGKKYPGEPFTSKEKCSYEEAPFIGGLAGWNPERIAKIRPKLLKLKMRILEIAHQCMTNKVTGKGGYTHFWDECESAISDTLSEEDWELCNATEDKYTNKSSFEPIPEGGWISPNAIKSVFEGGMKAGGIDSLIFNFIFFVEKELKLAKIQTRKMRMMSLLDNKIPESYDQIISSPKRAEIDKILVKSMVPDQEEIEFKQMFSKRLETGPWNKFKMPLYVTPEQYDPVKAYNRYIETHRKAGIDVTGRFAAPLPYKKQIFPLRLAPNTRWKDITIEFKDGHNVHIKAKDLNVYVNYKDMGFEDSRSLRPNLQWKLLQLLAHLKGELSWDDPEANKKVKKTKQLLADTLKVYFQIEEDPFLLYKYQKTYKIKINLIPETNPVGEFTELPSPKK